MPWRSSSSFWDPILLRPSCKDLWASEILRKFQAAFILYILNDTLLSSSQYGEFICSYFLKQFRRKDKILSLFSSPQAGVGDASFLLPSSPPLPCHFFTMAEYAYCMSFISQKFPWNAPRVLWMEKVGSWIPHLLPVIGANENWVSQERGWQSWSVLSVTSLTFSEGFCKTVVHFHWELCIATIAVAQSCRWLEKHQLKKSFSLREISSSIHQDLGFLLDSKVCNTYKFSIAPQLPVLIYWQGERKSCSVNSSICFMQLNT